MKNSQKGFIVPLLLALIAILLVGGGAYVYVQTKQSNQPAVVTPSVQTIPAAATQTPAVTHTTTSTKPSITVLSPNGGEAWQFGQTYTISWSSQKAPPGSHVRLGLTGPVEYSIQTGLPASGSYSWPVPPAGVIPPGSYQVTIVPGTTYKITAGLYSDIELSNITSDDSNAAFSIVAAPTGPTSESDILDSLRSNWQMVQSLIPFRPALGQGQASTWNSPTSVQFIGNSNFFVGLEDDYNPYVVLLNYNGGQFKVLRIFSKTSGFSQSDWQTYVNQYGDSSYSIGTYTTSVVRNGQIITYQNLTKVPENVFLLNH